MSDDLNWLIKALARTGATRQDVEEDISGDVTMEGLHNMATRIPAQAGLPVDALAMAMSGAGMTDMPPGEFVGSTDWIQRALGGDPEAGESVVADFVSPDPLDAVRAVGNLDKLLEAMVVFHGSPHKFDKFDMSKIGTGEGAQAYGHGLYVAEDPKVADGYKQRIAGAKWLDKNGRDVSTNQIMEEVFDAVKADGGSFDDAHFMQTNWRQVLEQGDKYKNTPGFNATQRVLDQHGIHLEQQGNLYELDLPDSTINKMLDWDKPLSEQPKSVRDMLGGIYDGNKTGAQIYKQMSLDKRDVQISRLDGYNQRLKELSKIMDDDSAGGYRSFRSDKGKKAAQEYDRLMAERSSMVPVKSTTAEGMQKSASDDLKELGIPGIKYLDGTSRTAGEGTRNFVLFDEDIATPLTRNGQPIRGETIDSIRDRWKEKGVVLDAYSGKGNKISVPKIVVPKGERGQGIGTEAMQDLINLADAEGKTIVLSPSTDFGGTSVSRLKEFYKNMGFVENTGRNKDFTISESMYRPPRGD